MHFPGILGAGTDAAATPRGDSGLAVEDRLAAAVAGSRPIVRALARRMHFAAREH